MLLWRRVPLLVYLALVLGSILVKALPAAGLGLYALRRDRLLAAALFASAAGDTVLGFQGYFLAGLVCFLIAQILYAANFARRFQPRPGRIAMAVALVAGIGAAATVIVQHAGPLAVRFVQPSRYLAIAILPTYFAAQYLISRGWLRRAGVQ